jgi:hypothetical protein
MPYRTKFRVSPTGVFAVLNEESTEGGRIELSSAIFAGDDEWFEFLTVVGDLELDPTTLRSRDCITHVQRGDVDQHYRTNHLLLRVTEPPQFIVTKLTQNNAVPHRIFLRDGYVTVITSVHDWNHVRNLADDIEDAYDTFELLGTTQIEGIGHPLGSDRISFDVHAALSTEQLRVVEAAHEMGMFEIPQEATGKEVADRLEVSQSTVSEKLRRAQQNICELFFGRRRTDTKLREAE